MEIRKGFPFFWLMMLIVEKDAMIVKRRRCSSVRMLVSTLLLLALLILPACGTHRRTEIELVPDTGKAAETPLPIGLSPAAEDPSELPQPERGAEAPVRSEETYILNTHTRKFHLPSCPSAAEMKPENRREVTADREALILEGYRPCGRCRP